MPVKVRGMSGIEHEVSYWDGRKLIQEYSRPVDVYQVISLGAIAYDLGAKEVIIRAPGFSDEEFLISPDKN